jgi:glycosyltransferase involved in cell wall biosynthesis
VLFLIQLLFYLLFYAKPYRFYKKAKRRESEQIHNLPSVSVIITATSEYENLSECLPVILNQDYPDYEVIVVNNGLTDDTDTLLKGLKRTYSHLYDTFLPKHTGIDISRKKLAMTIGIKAAKKDVLLFTEADSAPVGNQWIRSMMSGLSEDKDIVLGYCCFNKSGKFMNRLARFDNLLFGLQYLSCALLKKPYTGTYRNIAYRKELFFDNKGFSSLLNYEYSDGIFLNYIMSSDNTAVALSPDSFITTKLTGLSKWESIRIYQYKIKKHFRNFRWVSQIFSMETLNRYLFYILVVSLTIYSILLEKWNCTSIAGFLFVMQMMIEIVIINKAARHFYSGKYRFSYIIMDLMQPVYNLYFRIKAVKNNRKL